MGTPHVCFADEQQQELQQQHRTASNGSLNNNNNKLDVGYNNTGGTPSPGGSLSVSPTPRYERNLGFFRQLSRRFGLRSQDDLVHSDDAASVATSRSGGGGCGGGVAGVTLQEEDAHSSSTDSCSSGRGLNAHQSRLELMSMSCASSETSSTLDIEEQQEQMQHQQLQHQQAQQSKRKPISRASFSRLHRRSTSSLRRAFESLSLTSRSLSCSGPSPPPPLPAAGAQPAAALPLKSALKSASNVELHRQQQQQQKQPTGRSSSSCCGSASKNNKVKPPPQRILRQPVSYTYLKGMSGLPTQRVPRSSVCCQYARR
ncbi:uncharacterized protein LOC117140426 [Drosophila mauritiana]|uniref:Uncharacterized protein LOC117140426 n=1 Tax=Drosophila mauritiana TaxID=7226 RepID=A0A6P8K850_DROMA|nr:uncharacterized protein LOC117140426 [Drosophila mauritiana]